MEYLLYLIIYNIYSIQYGRPISLLYIRRHSLLTAFPDSAHPAAWPLPRSPALRTLPSLTFPCLKQTERLLKGPEKPPFRP